MYQKRDGFIRDYDVTKQLVLFDRIIYLLGLKRNPTYVFSAKIKIDSGDNLPLEQTLFCLFT